MCDGIYNLSEVNKLVAPVEQSWLSFVDSIQQSDTQKVIHGKVLERVIQYDRKGSIETIKPVMVDNDLNSDGMEYEGKVLLKKYELGRLLGQGTFAKVYYARNIKTGHSVAIKMFNKEKILRFNLVEQTKREITVMRMVKHPNILELYEVLASKTKICFVLEYAKGGELYDKVAEGRLPEDVARKYFQQLISAIDYCHSRGIYHRDLKLENLLLDENENLKVSDFGLSALVKSRRNNVLLHTACGTPAYVAPEVIDRLEYDGAKADIWSCGVLLFVFLAGYLPFHDPNLMDLYRKIRRSEYKCPSWFPYEVRRLLVRMLDPHPSTRIPIANIKDNKWFRRGLDDKLKHEAETREQVSMDVTTVLDSAGSSTSEGRQESTSIAHLNAFDIISLSPGLDLSNFFEDDDRKKEVWFTSWKPASAILSKLERMAKNLRLKVRKKEAGVVRLEGLKEGRKGVLAIDAEIFEVTSSFYLVEIKKSNGDTLEYQKMLKDEIRPSLKDIVWAWQGD